MPSPSSSAVLTRSPPALQHESTLLSLQSYRVRLEDQFKALKSSKAAAAEQAAAAVALLVEEIAVAENARARESAQSAQVIEQLRADNALLTAAACRLHEQWTRDAAELEELKAEIKRRDAQAASHELESRQLLHRGAALAEDRYRSSERRRKVDVGILARELRHSEELRDSMLQQHEARTTRLLEDGRCLARELRAAEAEREAVAAQGAAALSHAHAAADAATGAREAELAQMAQALADEATAMDEVRQAVREWEAGQHAERASTLCATETLEQLCHQMAISVAGLPAQLATASPELLDAWLSGEAGESFSEDGGSVPSSGLQREASLGTPSGGSACGATSPLQQSAYLQQRRVVRSSSFTHSTKRDTGARPCGSVSVASSLSDRPAWNHSTTPGKPKAARPMLPRSGSMLAASTVDIQLRFAAPAERLSGAGALVVPASHHAAAAIAYASPRASTYPSTDRRTSRESREHEPDASTRGTAAAHHVDAVRRSRG